VQDLPRHRVGRRSRRTPLPVLDQHADVVQLDPRPQRVRTQVVRPARRTRARCARGFADPPVVEVDAVADQVGDRAEVGRLEVPLRGACAIAEQRVVLVEAFDERLRDRARGGVDLGRDGGGGKRAGRHRVGSGGTRTARPDRTGHDTVAPQRHPPMPMPDATTKLTCARRAACAIVVATYAAGAGAQVYKCVDARGQVTYQQEACAGGASGGRSAERRAEGASWRATRRCGPQPRARGSRWWACPSRS